MKYKKNQKGSISITGSCDSFYLPSNRDRREEFFIPWQPSTWPETPESFNSDFLDALKKIFNETIILEIKNVLNDINKCSKNGLQHRGHIVAIALLCAIDAIASYAYSGGVSTRYKRFIKKHFPEDHRQYSEEIYKLYRNSFVHSWNLFEASISPGNENISFNNSILNFGLLNLFKAIEIATDDFLKKLENDKNLQKSALSRYKELRKTAR